VEVSRGREGWSEGGREGGRARMIVVFVVSPCRWFSTSHSLPHSHPSLPPSLPPSFSVSSMMHEYPPENILWGPYSLSWDEQAVKDYLALLTPERMHLTVVSKVGREGGRAGGRERRRGVIQGGRDGGREGCLSSTSQ